MNQIQNYKKGATQIETEPWLSSPTADIWGSASKICEQNFS